MHEAAIATRILETLFEEARNQGVAKIDRVTLQIGEISTVVPDALTFALQALSQDTIAKGLDVVIESVPLTVRCRECHHEGQADPPIPLCPGCSSPRVEILTGRELRLLTMDVD